MIGHRSDKLLTTLESELSTKGLTMRTVLIVDDDRFTREMLSGILKPNFRILTAKNGEEALHFAKGRPDLILLDLIMPGLSGFEVLKLLQQNPLTGEIPVVVLTGQQEDQVQIESLDLGAVDFLCKPINAKILIARINRLFKDEFPMVSQNQEMLIFSMLGHISEFRDNETGQHIHRISEYSKIVAKALGKDRAYCQRIYFASALHDIGKVGVPDAILLKPGKLSLSEWEIMKNHTKLGAEILANYQSETLLMAKRTCLHHHEKWDGTGYPFGLKGDEIPLEAQIVSIVDVFDALSSKRPYKESWPLEKVLSKIRALEGKSFSPKVVKAFHSGLGAITDTQKKFNALESVS